MPSIEISHGCAKGERPLVPQVCRVVEITEETPDVKSFRLQTLDGKKPFDCEPGQLGMFGLLQYGECMFVVSAQSDEWVQFTVKKVGMVTEQLHNLSGGDEVSLRGPYGNWWPTEGCRGKDMLFIAGGIGLEFSVNRVGHFLLEGRYYYGLGNIFKNSKSDYFGKSNFGQIVVKASYLFDIVSTKNDKIK